MSVTSSERKQLVEAAKTVKHDPLEISSELAAKFTSPSIVYIRVCKRDREARLALVISRLNLCLCGALTGKMIKLLRFDEIRSIEYRKTRVRLQMAYELTFRLTPPEPDIILLFDDSPLNVSKFDMAKLMSPLNICRTALGLTPLDPRTMDPGAPPPQPLREVQQQEGLRPSEKIDAANRRKEEEAERARVHEAAAEKIREENRKHAAEQAALAQEARDAAEAEERKKERMRLEAEERQAEISVNDIVVKTVRKRRPHEPTHSTPKRWFPTTATSMDVQTLPPPLPTPSPSTAQYWDRFVDGWEEEGRVEIG